MYCILAKTSSFFIKTLFCNWKFIPLGCSIFFISLVEGRMLQFLELKLEKVSRTFSSWTVNFKMALTSGSSHGGKRRNSGRKRIFGTPKRAMKEWLKSHKHVYFEARQFLSHGMKWNASQAMKLAPILASQRTCCQWNMIHVMRKQRSF